MTRLPVLLLCAVLLTGSVAPAQSAMNLTPIHLASSADEVIASILYARKAGLFAQAGLEVEITKQSSGAAIAAAVSSGTYDLGTSSLIALFNARQRGIAFSLVAPGVSYDAKTPYSELVVAADSAIRSGADLDGKTIGIQSLNDLDSIATRAWIDRYGGDSKTARFVEIPMSAKAAALEAHRIDAGIIGQPYLAAALAGGKVRVLGPALSAVGTGFIQSVWFTTTSWVSQHQEAAKKFASVVERANAYTNGHHEQVAPLLAQFSQLSLAELHGTLGTSLRAADIQPVIDVAAKYGTIERPFPARELLGVP